MVAIALSSSRNKAIAYMDDYDIVARSEFQKTKTNPTSTGPWAGLAWRPIDGSTVAIAYC